MERNVIEGSLNWYPLGYRFRPTDRQLLINYLKNKVLNLPLPCSAIKDVNIYRYSPRRLYDMYKEPGEEVMYFFTLRDRKCPNRAADDGYWKATGVKQPVGERGNPIGYKISLVYFRGTYNEAQKTNWLMYEFTLNSKRALTSSGNPHDMKLDEWVINKVYKKEGKYGMGEGTDSEVPLVRSRPELPNLPSLPNPEMKSCTSCQLGPCCSGRYVISMPTTVFHPLAMFCTSSQSMPQLNQDHMLPSTAGFDTGDHISDGNTFSEYYNYHPEPKQ